MPITTEVVSSNPTQMRCTALCDKTCQWFATGQWFSPGTLVSSTNKTDHHDITEILLKVTLNTISLTLYLHMFFFKATPFLFFFQYRFMDSTFLGFETLTLVPYEPNLINYDLLNTEQVSYYFIGIFWFLYETYKKKMRGDWHNCWHYIYTLIY